MLNAEGTAWVSKGGPPDEARTAPNQPCLQTKLSQPQCVKLGSRAVEQCAILEDSWRGRFASGWSVPLAAAGGIEGVMQFAFCREYEWLPREQELFRAAAERCLMAA